MKLFVNYKEGNTIVLEENDFKDWNTLLKNMRGNRPRYLFTPVDLTKEMLEDLSANISIGGIQFTKICKYECCDFERR